MYMGLFTSKCTSIQQFILVNVYGFSDPIYRQNHNVKEIHLTSKHLYLSNNILHHIWQPLEINIVYRVQIIEQNFEL